VLWLIIFGMSQRRSPSFVYEKERERERRRENPLL
jgi:hypothetical protein